MSTATAEPLADIRADYWIQARHPLSALVFLLPLLVTYEVGVLKFSEAASQQIRNGADCWMRGWLDAAGISTALALPALVAGGLLLWHGLSRISWKPSLEVLGGMLAESLLFAFTLVLAGRVMQLVFHQLHLPEVACLPDAAPPLVQISTGAATAAGASSTVWPRLVTFLGAGIYEEFLFRLCLLPLCLLLFRLLRLDARRAAFLAILTTSVGFALAHHIGPDAEPVALFRFTFRTLAGMFFAGLFVLRGFGVTVGTHAAYDILVGVLLVDSGTVAS